MMSKIYFHHYPVNHKQQEQSFGLRMLLWTVEGLEETRTEIKTLSVLRKISKHLKKYFCLNVQTRTFTFANTSC